MWEKPGLQRKYRLRKRKSAVEDDPKKSWSWAEMEEGVEQEEVGLEVSLVGID